MGAHDLDRGHPFLCRIDLSLFRFGLTCGAVLLGQPDAGGFKFLLDLDDVPWIYVGSGGLAVFIEREFPLRGCEANASGFLVEVAEVVMDGGVGRVAIDGLASILL